jgi:hypothetical protein
MQANRKSNPIKSIIRLEVIQDDPGRSGLRTIQLHSYIPPDEKKRTRKVVAIQIVDLKDKPVEQVAKEYLIACEKSLTDSKTNSSQDSDLRGFVDRENLKIKDRMQGEKDSPWRLKDNTSGSLVKAESTPVLDQVQVGEVRNLKYKGLPVTQEVVFGYKCGDYPVYGASARIELTEKSELLSATIISPIDPEAFIMHESSKPRGLQDILPIVLEKAGYFPNITGDLRKDYPIKWYFDPHKEIWRVAYIIDNIPKPTLDRQAQLHEQDVKPSNRWGMLKPPVSDYVIDAYNPQLIAEI